MRKAGSMDDMRKLVVLAFVSLDGVMQAPGGKNEDPSGSFRFGGWTVPYFDEALGTEMSHEMSEPAEVLLGRKTYEIFAAYWPDSNEEGAEIINNTKRYVVSHKAFTSDWKGTTVITDDAVNEVRKLKSSDGPMLQVHGSSELIQTLLQHDLVDELWLKIFPVTLGKGKRLFGEGTIPAAFKLIESSVTPQGVIIASYRRSGAVKTGSF